MSANSNNRRQSDDHRHKNSPCVKEYDMSLKCLDDNGYDGSQCHDYFENYKNCKKFWSMIQSKRRIEGIKPVLPPPEEREAVKQEYLSHLSSS